MINKISKLSILKFLYGLALLSITLSAITSLLDEKVSRYFFYYSGYFSLVGLLFSKPKLSRYPLIVLGSILLLFLSKALWSLIFEHGLAANHLQLGSDYLAVAKRIFLTFVIGIFLCGHGNLFTQPRKILIYRALVSGFIVISGYGIYQYLTGMERVEFAIDRATISAYSYTMFSLVTLFSWIKLSQCSKKWLPIILLFSISYALIFLTGTRNMMIGYPAIALFTLLISSDLPKKKVVLAFSALMLVALAASYNSFIKPKIETTISEYQTYIDDRGNSFGSLTTRLAMWKVGVICSETHWLGMSKPERRACFEQYVAEHKTDSVALIYEPVHLHNEIIETASMQGILGVLALCGFYLATLYAAFKSANPWLGIVAATVIFSGLTDVVFLSREMTSLVGALLVLALLLNQRQSTDNTP